MTRLFLATLTAIAASRGVACAQFVEDFSDGEFLSEPAWIGDVDLWSIVPWAADYALQSAGAALSDTLSIATSSPVTHGTWTFTLDYDGGQLSNFNQVRVFLVSSTATLSDDGTGYYLQIGTNARDVRLYRTVATSGRVLIGSGSDPALQAETATLRYVVKRDLDGSWTVRSNDHELFVAPESDPPAIASSYFGIWLKHSASRHDAYRFDDIRVALDDTPDTTAPSVVSVTVEDPRTLRVTYSEPVDWSTACRTSAYNVETLNVMPATVLCESDFPSEVSLRFDAALVPGRHTLAVDGVADTAGNALVGAIVEFDVHPAFGSPHANSVVVNEIHFAPEDPDLEFVELYNRSDSTFDLSGFDLADSRRVFVSVTTETEAIEPGGFAVLARSPSALSNEFDGVRSVAPASWPTLNNGGDAVVLRYGTTTVDSVVYSASWGQTGTSLERVDPAGASTHQSNWRPSMVQATPGARNTAYAPDLEPPVALLAEEADSSTVRIYFSEPIDPSTVVAATVSIRSVGATSIELTDDVTISATFAGAITGERITVTELADFAGNTIVQTVLVVSRPPRRRDLVFSEIMFDPLADESDGRPDQPEYVELANRSADLVSLGGIALTGEPDEDGSVDTLATIVPGMALMPGHRAIIFAESEQVPDADLYVASAIVLAFPVDYRRVGVPLISASASRLALRNEGRGLRMLDSVGLTVDSLHYSPDWHRPGIRDATGIALERIDPEGSSTDARNWTSSVDPTGGTPGLINSVNLSPDRFDDTSGIHVEPSPFSPDEDGVDDHTGISFTLAYPSVIRLRIFDSRGRLVRTLADADLAGTSGTMIWDGLGDGDRRLSTGVYIILLEAFDETTGNSERHKVTVVLARHLD